MSLSAHDRQALDAIEEGLVASDPRLAAMLSTFSRLADGESIPAREQITAGTPRRVLPRRRRLAHIAVALWVLMTFATAIVIVVVGHTGRP